MDKFTIKSNSARAAVTDRGAMLTSLYKNGIEYLWQGDPAYWAGQAPVCFPVNGMLPNDTAVAFGKKCNMKRHGIARINPFSVSEQTDCSVTFVQCSDDNTRAQFPFDYRLEISYTIMGDTVTTRYKVVNMGSDKLPFVIGGHPAFNCPVCKGEMFEDYKVIFSSNTGIKPLRPDHITGLVDINKRYDVLKGGDTLRLSHDLFYDDALIFDNVKAKSAVLIGKNHKGIRIDYPDMNNLLIWSAENDAPFVALEPWSGISNCSDETNVFEDKRGMTILEPGESAVLSFDITMI